MPNIHIAPVRISDTERDRALIRELRSGIQLKEALEHEREIVAAHEAAQMRDAKTIGGLGKHVSTMPHWEFFNLVRKYGHDEVHSRGFHKYYQKKFPHLATASV